MELKHRVDRLTILRRRGAPVTASRTQVGIKIKEIPAPGTSGTGRWRTFSWMKLKKCQNNFLDSESIKYQFSFTYICTALFRMRLLRLYIKGEHFSILYDQN